MREEGLVARDEDVLHAHQATNVVRYLGALGVVEERGLQSWRVR